MNIFDIINVPLGWIMRVCYSLVNNYFIALLLFAIIMQILLLPFSIKQQKNSVRQAMLAPKIQALRKKYAGRTDQATQQKMQEETMELYKRENYNPASGCLPLLIQMPILLSLYNVVMNPLRYVTGLSADRITELQTYMTDTLQLDLGTHGQFIRMLEEVRKNVSQFTSIAPELAEPDIILPAMTMGPFDLAQVPQVAWNWLILVPILTFVVSFFSQKITRLFTYQSPETIEAQKNPSMRIMNISMPLLSVWIAFSVPAAIGMYWIFRNIISTIQQILLSRLIPTPRFTEEDYKAAEKEMKVGKPRRDKAKIPPRSLHHIDDEEYQARREAKIAELKAAEEAEAAEEAAEAEAEKNAASDSAAEEKSAPEKEQASAPVLKEDNKTAYEKKITPTSGPKYEKTGKKYKK